MDFQEIPVISYIKATPHALSELSVDTAGITLL